MSDNKDLKDQKDNKEPGMGPGRRKTVRKGMFSKDCKFIFFTFNRIELIHSVQYDY